MKFTFFCFCLLFNLSWAWAQEDCQKIDLEVEDKVIEADLCQSEDEVTILSDTPIKREHLLYAGLNLGLPFMGVELTYVQLRDQAQFFHTSLALEGSLGGSALTLRGGYHPFGNGLYAGGLARGYEGLPGDWGFMVGPTLGIAGGKKFLTGQLGISYVGGYDSRVGEATFAPDITLGIRIRLFKQ